MTADPDLACGKWHRIAEGTVEGADRHAYEGRLHAVKTTTHGVSQHPERQDVRCLGELANLVCRERFARFNAAEVLVEVGHLKAGVKVQGSEFSLDCGGYPFRQRQRVATGSSRDSGRALFAYRANEVDQLDRKRFLLINLQLATLDDWTGCGGRLGSHQTINLHLARRIVD